MQEIRKSLTESDLNSIHSRPRIRVIDTCLSIDECLIDLKSRQRMLRLIQAFLNAPDYRMNKEQIYNYVYRQETSWIDLSSRYQICMVQNINKLLSRTRFFISEHLRAHRYLAQFDWLSFDREHNEWVLCINKPYEKRSPGVVKIYH